MNIDIFDDKYRYVGTAGKKEAHQKGLWHHVFTAIVLLKESQTIVLQRKAPGRYEFDRPDSVDISVGGHLDSGEKIADGVREIEEELGLKVQFEQLIPLGIRQTAATVAPDYIANEFQHIFLLPLEMKLEDFRLPGGEVTGIVEVPLREGIDLLLDRRTDVRVRTLYVGEEGQRLEEGTLTKGDFTKAYIELDQLFLRLFIAARRWSDKEDPAQIFW